MGKTPKPITLVVHPTLVDLPQFVAMRDQGHIVMSMDAVQCVGSKLTDVDMVLGSNAWSFDSRQMYLLDKVVQTCRARKYERGKKAAQAKARKVKEPTSHEITWTPADGTPVKEDVSE